MLDATILGTARHNRRLDFVNKDINELIMAYGSMEAARLAMDIADSQVIIDHIKANALVVPGLTLLAPSGGGNVTGTATIT
jgi:hypothetical protein